VEAVAEVSGPEANYAASWTIVSVGVVHLLAR